MSLKFDKTCILDPNVSHHPTRLIMLITTLRQFERNTHLQNRLIDFSSTHQWEVSNDEYKSIRNKRLFSSVTH